MDLCMSASWSFCAFLFLGEMVSHSSTVLISHHLHYYKKCCLLLRVIHDLKVMCFNQGLHETHTQRFSSSSGGLWVGRVWIPAQLPSRHMIWPSEEFTIFSLTDLGNLHLKSTQERFWWAHTCL